MNLLVLMLHRASAGRHGNPAGMLDLMFARVAERYHNVLPGEPLQTGRLNVCLSFDDAYFDFYGVVYPLLLKHRLRALLAVPPGVIVDRVATSSRERLEIESADAFADPTRGGFCTWAELTEMTWAGRVAIASHGFSHRRLDRSEVDLDFEVAMSRAVLESRLAVAVESFVFPYGRYSRAALAKVREKYRHAFRIGGAMNSGWGAGLRYRVDADRLQHPGSVFEPARLMVYRTRYWWNRLRRR